MEDGLFRTNDRFPDLIDKINSKIKENSVQNILVTVGIYFMDNSAHQNLLLFQIPQRKTRVSRVSVSIIEPNFTGNFKETVYTNSLSQIIKHFFPDFLFTGYYLPQCKKVAEHGGLCVPVSILSYFYRNRLDYYAIEGLLYEFLNDEIKEISIFYNQIAEYFRVTQPTFMNVSLPYVNINPDFEQTLRVTKAFPKDTPKPEIVRFNLNKDYTESPPPSPRTMEKIMDTWLL
jgi:hypothetical protein